MFESETIALDTIARVVGLYQSIARMLYFSGTLDNPVAPLEDSPLKINIKLLVDVANGNSHYEHQVADALQSVVEATEAINRPQSLESVIQHVQLWLHRDELITITEASQILRGNTEKGDLMYIRRLISSGKLTEYTDPNEPNHTKNKRVSRKEVESIQDD